MKLNLSFIRLNIIIFGVLCYWVVFFKREGEYTSKCGLILKSDWSECII